MRQAGRYMSEYRALRELGAELRFKPLWLEDLVGLARNLLQSRVIH